MKYTNEQIAKSLDLWNTYFNTQALMTDEDFANMSFEERLQLLNESYPE